MNKIYAALVVLILFIIFLLFSGHSDASFEKICIPSIVPSQEPSEYPSETPVISEMVTPSITEVPVATETPTLTTTVPPSPHGDGLSDGRSSCPSCTAAPVIPAMPPATGR